MFPYARHHALCLRETLLEATILLCADLQEYWWLRLFSLASTTFI
jgi:hypothetical protein